MPDITMCKAKDSDGDLCPLRFKCYRFLASPSEQQSYFTEAPYIYTKRPREVDRIHRVRSNFKVECKFFDDIETSVPISGIS